VAVKEILNGDIREIKLISQLQHPNIVEYYGYYRAENKICLVMEFLGGGELHKYLINMDNVGFDYNIKI
jgi:serine/threonine protein kinase